MKIIKNLVQIIINPVKGYNMISEEPKYYRAISVVFISSLFLAMCEKLIFPEEYIVRIDALKDSLPFISPHAENFGIIIFGFLNAINIFVLCAILSAIFFLAGLIFSKGINFKKIFKVLFVANCFVTVVIDLSFSLLEFIMPQDIIIYQVLKQGINFWYGLLLFLMIKKIFLFRFIKTLIVSIIAFLIMGVIFIVGGITFSEFINWRKNERIKGSLNSIQQNWRKAEFKNIFLMSEKAYVDISVDFKWKRTEEIIELTKDNSFQQHIESYLEDYIFIAINLIINKYTFTYISQQKENFAREILETTNKRLKEGPNEGLEILDLQIRKIILYKK
jgi:hypothetical protein